MKPDPDDTPEGATVEHYKQMLARRAELYVEPADLNKEKGRS